MRKLESFDWWDDLVRLKDELSLRELGDKFGVTPGAITSALKRNGLTRQPAPPGPRALRKKSTNDLPPEPGEAPVKKATAKKTTKKTAPKKVAAPVVSKNARRTPQRRRKSRIDPFAHLVGEVADRIVAEQANVTINAVRNYRVVRGIMAAGRRGSQPEAVVEAPVVEAPVVEAPVVVAAPAPIAALPVAESGAQQAYQVTLDDGRTGIVVGVTLVAAATRAEAAGNVASLTLLGPVF